MRHTASLLCQLCRASRTAVFAGLFFLVPATQAATPYEREQLQLILGQLGNIQVLADRSESALTPSTQDRYRFDYERLRKDIEAMRRGIRSYMTPERAQPRDLNELSDNYRLDMRIHSGE